MNNRELKKEWKKFTENEYDMHFSINFDRPQQESIRYTNIFLNHLHRKYNSQVFKSIYFTIDHGNTRIHKSHAHCLIKCKPDYPKLYEVINIASPKDGIFQELEIRFRNWKFKHDIPKASMKVSCSKKVLKELGIGLYKNFCCDCLTKKRNIDRIYDIKKELEGENNSKVGIVNDPCLNCKRKDYGKGWDSKEIVEYIFKNNNFNVNDHHFLSDHSIEFYKWDMDF
jgi:hypothetical protein